MRGIIRPKDIKNEEPKVPQQSYDHLHDCQQEGYPANRGVINTLSVEKEGYHPRRHVEIRSLVQAGSDKPHDGRAYDSARQT